VSVAATVHNSALVYVALAVYSAAAMHYAATVYNTVLAYVTLAVYAASTATSLALVAL
jgi:hypothetical protein